MLRADRKLSLLDRIDRQMVVDDIVLHDIHGRGKLISGWEGFLQVEFSSGVRKFTDQDGLCLLPDKTEGIWLLFPSHQIEMRYADALARIRDALNTQFAHAEAIYEEELSTYVGRTEFEEEKVCFVRNWMKRHLPISANGTQQLPDDEQLRAIAEVNGHVQVVARAGSGKTATLVNRAYFMVKHCRVDPSRLLLLAFNKKAAVEIRRRILILSEPQAELAIKSEVEGRNSKLSKRRNVARLEIETEVVDSIAKRFQVKLPHVMTFHALAYAIVHPEDTLLYDQPEADSQGLSTVLQRVIDDHLQIPAYKNKIRDLMLSHFKEDWERIVSGRFDQTKQEFLKFRRSLPRESIGGDLIKSFGEKLIADFLFEHGISYKYERNHWWGNLNYRPDFTIFKTSTSGVIVEYFGLAGDPDYDEMSLEKRRYWLHKPNWTLLEFCPKDITTVGIDSFLDRLKSSLLDQGIACNRLSEDEIWDRVHDRAIDRFTVASVNFIGRCRKQSLSPQDLQSRIDAYEPLSTIESAFLELVQTLYAAYLELLGSTGEDDFDGLMQRAVETISSGQTRFERKSGSGDLRDIHHIFIDEFQDFSDLFYRLLNSIRTVNSSVELFCVGDDWQAINGFAGSDLRFFRNFGKWFGKFKKIDISTNYRSSKSIVAVGNALMKGQGTPAVAHLNEEGTLLVADAIDFEPTLAEKQRHPGDVITPMVSRIVKDALAEGKDVVMLCRRNRLPWFVNFLENGVANKGLSSYLDLLRSLFAKGQNERISISTAHKYKGLEKSVVIVMDAVARSYPLIHPDWAFSRILGDSPEDISEEERRLFYVALTRAVDKLIIITEKKGRSPFLDEIAGEMVLAKIDWSDFPPVKSRTTRLIVIVGNQEQKGVSPTFAIKDQLKASGYQWQSSGWNGWAKSFDTNGFEIAQLREEIWSGDADGLDVRIFDESECLLGRFLIDRGEWTCALDNLGSVLSSFEARQGDTAVKPQARM